MMRCMWMQHFIQVQEMGCQLSMCEDIIHAPEMSFCPSDAEGLQSDYNEILFSLEAVEHRSPAWYNDFSPNAHVIKADERMQ